MLPYGLVLSVWLSTTTVSFVNVGISKILTVLRKYSMYLIPQKSGRGCWILTGTWIQVTDFFWRPIGWVL